MKTEFDINDYVWVLFQIREINVKNKDVIKYDLREVSSKRRGIDLLSKEEKELVRANFREEYNFETGNHEIKIYKLVEPEEKIGEWNEKIGSSGLEFIECSNCKERIVRNVKDARFFRMVANIKPKYCPWCGAKMKGEEVEGSN